MCLDLYTAAFLKWQRGGGGGLVGIWENKKTAFLVTCSSLSLNRAWAPLFFSHAWVPCLLKVL